jgi:hypothetical protein
MGSCDILLSAEGYTSTVAKNATGVTSTLKVKATPAEKHGSHNITVSTNGGDATATLQLYVIGEHVFNWADEVHGQAYK